MVAFLFRGSLINGPSDPFCHPHATPANAGVHCNGHTRRHEDTKGTKLLEKGTKLLKLPPLKVARAQGRQEADDFDLRVHCGAPPPTRVEPLGARGHSLNTNGNNIVGDGLKPTPAARGPPRVGREGSVQAVRERPVHVGRLAQGSFTNGESPSGAVTQVRELFGSASAGLGIRSCFTGPLESNRTIVTSTKTSEHHPVEHCERAGKGPFSGSVHSCALAPLR